MRWAPDLMRDPEATLITQISLLQIVKAIDGSRWIGTCLLGMDNCTAFRFCPLEGFWRGFRKQLEAKLRQTSLADVIKLRHDLRDGRREERFWAAAREGHGMKVFPD